MQTFAFRLNIQLFLQNLRWVSFIHSFFIFFFTFILHSYLINADKGHDHLFSLDSRPLLTSSLLYWNKSTELYEAEDRYKMAWQQRKVWTSMPGIIKTLWPWQTFSSKYNSLDWGSIRSSPRNGIGPISNKYMRFWSQLKIWNWGSSLTP